MSLPTVANVCQINHRAIAYLGDDCPLCAQRTRAETSPHSYGTRCGGPLAEGHIWPHTYQLLQVLRRQFAPKVSDSELRALLP